MPENATPTMAPTVSHHVNLSILLANGETIEAPLAAWVAAILTELPREQSARIFERMQKKNLVYRTPGSHVLRAEGASLSALLGGKGR